MSALAFKRTLLAGALMVAAAGFVALPALAQSHSGGIGGSAGAGVSARLAQA